MTDEERFDPADELRKDIESAIEGQQPKEPSPDPEAAAPEPEREKEESAAEPGERERDEKGRFVAKGDAEAPEEPAEEPKDAKVELAAPDTAKTESRPPSGFSVASKAVWDTLPQSVRDDIAKREQDFEGGLKRYSGLARFAEAAERNGTTLQQAVTDYDAVESTLRQNFIGGIEYICQRMGVDPRQLTQAMAQRYYPQAQSDSAGAAGAAGQADQPAPQQPRQPIVDPNAIAQHVAQVLRTEAEQRDINSQIAAFGADPKNRFFANLRPIMARLVAADDSLNLKTAYEAACWLNPEIRAILINEANGGRNREAAATASRSRIAAKAVGGAPAPGVNPDQSGKRKDLSLEEEIRAAVDVQSGAA